MGKLKAFSLALLLSCTYVGSLYVAPEKYGRDHPITIKHRFMRVSVASMLSCIISYMSSSVCVQQQQQQPGDDGALCASLFAWIGIRTEAWIPAVVAPIILLSVLFTGPISTMCIDGTATSLISFDVKDVKFWRNYIVAPLSEELVFRGCMLPILVPSFGKVTSILIGPLFFGIAHIHHAYEQYRNRFYTVRQIAIQTVFQTFYTTIFGILSSYIFLRTGHLLSAFLSHAFCNVMGFPDFETAINHKHRRLIALLYVVGLFLFLYLLGPALQPRFFNNRLYA